MIEIDGSQGEGGGQVLRSALALSAITGKGVHLYNIRARRSKPGLMAQHLKSVDAAAAVCKAKVSGASLCQPANKKSANQDSKMSPDPESKCSLASFGNDLRLPTGVQFLCECGG